MLKNTSTKKKLLLLPIAFVIITLFSAFLYSYFSSIAEKRSSAAVQTDMFIQQVLKGRISVYQFLRAPDEAKAQKVKEDFSNLDNSVLELQKKLTAKENIDLCTEIIGQSKSYIKYFDKLAQQRINDHKNGIEKESPEILSLIKDMVAVGLDLEKYFI